MKFAARLAGGKTVFILAVATGLVVVCGLSPSAQADSPPPVNTVPPSISGATRPGATLTAQPGTWSPAGLGYDWQWQRCDASLSCTTVQHDPVTLGRFTDFYTVSTADLGFSIRVLVFTADPLGVGPTSAAVASAPTAVITESGAPFEDATALASTLAGPGISVTSATFQGAPDAIGSFAGDAASIGIDSGVGMSTGLFSGGTPLSCSKGVQGPNQCPNNSTDFGFGGNSDLTALVGQPTFDAADLSISFVPKFSTISFQYVFGSEEYDEYANTNYNDVFAFYVDGTNCAVVPGTDEPVSVDTINNGNPSGDTTPHNADLFRDNTDGHLDTELDGLTTVLDCRASVIPNQPNTLSLEIADSSDGLYDSAVFVGAGSIVSSDTALATTLTAGSQTGPSLSVAPGTAVADQADLTGINAPAATGTVTYTVYSDNACSTAVADGGTKTVQGGAVPASDPVTLTTPGTYYWQAAYSGDQANNSAMSACTDESETVAFDTATVTYTGAIIATYSQPLTLAAHLADTTTGQPLGGRTISFTVGTGTSAQTANATTDTSGDATTVLAQLSSPAPSAPITVSYAGDSTTTPANTSASITVAPDTCSVSYTGPTTISGSSTTLSASLVDTDPPVGTLSAHTVTFTLTGSSGTTSTYTASTSTAGAASVKAALAAGTYALTVSAADNYYGPCASAPTMIGTPAKATAVLGAGTAKIGRQVLQFSVALIPVKTNYTTLIAATINYGTVFQAGTVNAVTTVSHNDIRWTGRGIWSSHTPVTYTIEAVAGDPLKQTSSRISLTIQAANGDILFTTAGLVNLASGGFVIG